MNRTTKPVASYGWRFRQLQNGIWGCELRSYYDRDLILPRLRVGDRVAATVITRAGQERRRMILVTSVEYYTSDHGPTRAEGVIVSQPLDRRQ